MANVFQKVRVLALGNIHAMLDAAIDMNSIAVVRQHARDLEEARGDLGKEIAVVKGRISALGAANASIKKRIKRLNENIELILGDSDVTNDTKAVGLEARIMGYEEEITSNAGEVKILEKTLEDYRKAFSAIDAKFKEMVSKISTLQATERALKAKSAAARAIRSAAGVMNAASSVSIDNISVRIQEDDARATAELEMALGGIDNDADADANLARAMARVEARKRKLEANKKAA